MFLWCNGVKKCLYPVFFLNKQLLSSSIFQINYIFIHLFGVAVKWFGSILFITPKFSINVFHVFNNQR